jgi:hypothetical protein
VSTVRRHSRVLTDLPPELRREVDRLLLEPGVTYDDIREFLAGRGYDISRSSIGRYGKEYLESYQRLKIAIDQAKCMKAEAGEGLALEEAVVAVASSGKATFVAARVGSGLRRLPLAGHA